MSKETAPFLLLKLRTCDDLDDFSKLKFTLAGAVEKSPVRVDLRLAYDADLAALPVLHQMNVDLFGFSRRFMVLSVEPVQDGANMFTFYPTPGQPVVKPTVDSIAAAWAGHLANRPDFATTKAQMQRDIDFISDYMNRRPSTSEILAYGAAGRTGN